MGINVTGLVLGAGLEVHNFPPVFLELGHCTHVTRAWVKGKAKGIQLRSFNCSWALVASHGFMNVSFETHLLLLFSSNPSLSVTVYALCSSARVWRLLTPEHDTRECCWSGWRQPVST